MNTLDKWLHDAINFPIEECELSDLRAQSYEDGSRIERLISLVKEKDEASRKTLAYLEESNLNNTEFAKIKDIQNKALALTETLR